MNGNPSPGALREWRKATEFSQERLAAKAGCSVSMVKLLESGYAPSTAMCFTGQQRGFCQRGGDVNVWQPGGRLQNLGFGAAGRPDDEQPDRVAVEQVRGDRAQHGV